MKYLAELLRYNSQINVDEADFNSLLSNDPDIEYIQKSNTYQLDFVPNDSLLSQQWALEKIKAFRCVGYNKRIRLNISSRN